MTHNDLDQLFAAAGKAPVETSVEEISTWVSMTAATATGVMGVAAKLKLFIAKKSVIMIGSTFITGAAIVTTAVFNQSPTPEPNNTPIIAQADVYESQHAAEQEDIIVFDEYSEPDTVIDVPEITPQEVEADFPEATEAPVQAQPPKQEEATEHTRTVAASGSAFRKRPRRLPFLKKRHDDLIKENRDVSSFDELEITGAFDVYLTQGGKEAVVVEAAPEMQQYIEVKNEGNRLSIANVHDKKVKKMKKVIVHITIKDLKEIDFSGIGDIVSKSALNLTELELDHAGIGDADLELECTTLAFDHTGVGDIKVSGNVNTVTFDYSGIGNIEAGDLQANEAKLDHAGLGDVYVNASNELKVDFTGIGKVRYYGDPKNKTIDKAGIGSVKAK